VVDQLEINEDLRLTWSEPVASEADPAEAAFLGPLGVPRTHEQRAQLLHQNYQAVPDENYLDIPEECL
jgi:hypothetical protein